MEASKEALSLRAQAHEQMSDYASAKKDVRMLMDKLGLHQVYAPEYARLHALETDHYSTLNLARDASPRTIKKAYHKAAMQWHPDRHKHSTTSLQKKSLHMITLLNASKEVLLSPGKRRGV